VGQVASIERILKEGEKIKLFFINDGPDMLPFEGLGNISLLQAIDDLNLVDHPKAFKRRQV